MSSDSDAGLLYRWRGGDSTSGELLFERYFDSIECFFVNKVTEDPADLVQQTFRACVEARDRIEDGRHFRSYLFGIANNVLRRHLRDRYRCREDMLSSCSIHDITPGPSAMVAERQEHRLLAMALRRLPLALQVQLELSYWEGMTSEQIGEVLQMKPSTVRTHLIRGRRLLAEIIQELSAMPGAIEDTISDLDAWAADLRDQIRSLP